ncbi:hypothetical protein IYZ83_003280 [Wolbachia pipientis]|uniref:hypothetical protein n=1 Tax=Wolbachia pipientis TaxID=955 RepID=UPI001F2D3166|nr:hypothetical protein [Wolbachia pipientis]UIP91190.1 hypothetical protein IYZ83_003280 [Wolbachia pipientis]
MFVLFFFIPYFHPLFSCFSSGLFLADKGLKLTPEDVATKLIENPSFQASAKIAVNAQDSEFQEAVKAVMSQPSFEIPTDSNSPLSWGW